MALKIIFMGTPEFSVKILDSIKKSKHHVLEVYTQSPKKKKRGQAIKLTPVHEYSIKNNIKVRHPEKIDIEEELENFKQKKPDVVVVVAYGKILPPKLLSFKNINFINVHASLLPKWRGAAPIQRSIMNLEKETGISIMKITPKLDAGPVLMRSKKVIAKINALYPNPGSWFEYKGSRLKIIKAIEVKAQGKPGEILDNKFTIACLENAIQILEIQKEGKKNMHTSEYLKGNDLEIGFNVK